MTDITLKNALTKYSYERNLKMTKEKKLSHKVRYTWWRAWGFLFMV